MDYQTRQIHSCEDCPIGQEMAEEQRRRKTELIAVVAIVLVVFLTFWVVGLVQKNRAQVERLGVEPL